MLKSTILLTMIAGLMNGSYAFPIKYMASWRDENIWLVFSIIAFVLMPWLSLSVIDPDVIRLIAFMPKTTLFVLLVSGFLFGIGMIVFTYSLRYIGLGVSFVLNISSSTVLATLLPIIWMDPGRLFTLFGIAEMVALFFFCIAVITAYFASCHKSTDITSSQHPFETTNVAKGVIFGALSGILTSAQGFSYAFSTTALKANIKGYSNITLMSAPWIPIFTAAFVPYFLYFLHKCIANNTIKNIINKKSVTYFPLCFMMGILYFGSLIIFSHATINLGQMGAVIAWPMLMIFIIITSNLWSFIHREWRNAKRTAYMYLSASLLSFVLAIVSLSIAGYLNKYS